MMRSRSWMPSAGTQRTCSATRWAASWPSAPPCGIPGRVRSITSSASLPGDAGSLGAARYVRLGTVARLARMKFPEGHDGDIALAVTATRAVASPAYPFDEQEVRRMAERDQVSGVRDTAAQSRQAGAKWHGGRLSQLRVPTLVLHGAQDPLLRPGAARRTAAAISGARLVILPGVGHYLPAAVYPQVADEVRSLPTRPPRPRRSRARPGNGTVETLLDALVPARMTPCETRTGPS